MPRSSAMPFTSEPEVDQQAARIGGYGILGWMVFSHGT